MLRLGLAGMVVVSHLSDWEVGRPAVFLFFLLSGYWVVKIYHKDGPALARLLTFYLGRALRIWLPFAAAVLVTLWLIDPSRADKITSQTWMLFGLAGHGQDPLGVAWSLDIELQFYALVPLLVWATLRGRRFTLLLGVAALTGLGWWAVLVHNIWTVFAFLPAFGLGLGFALFGWRVSRVQAWCSALAFCLAGALLIWIPELRSVLSKTAPDPLPADLIGLAWVGLLAPWVMRLNARPTGAFDRHLGNLSYPLYLLHWPVIAALAAQSAEFGSLQKLTALGMTSAAVLLFYLALDRPLEYIRQYILRAWIALSPRMRIHTRRVPLDLNP